MNKQNITCICTIENSSHQGQQHTSFECNQKVNVSKENNIKLNESQRDKCYIFSFFSSSRFHIETKVYMT